MQIILGASKEENRETGISSPKDEGVIGELMQGNYKSMIYQFLLLKVRCGPTTVMMSSR